MDDDGSIKACHMNEHATNEEIPAPAATCVGSENQAGILT